ncbi:MAG: hypothetical protein NC390_03935 [Fusobacterium sp.]|nr:hypothetical protein [Fusobacterium sp.]
MSEQNQMAISPVTAGLVGAGVGATNYFVGIGAKPKEGYRNTTELLNLKDDEFKKLADKIEKDGDDAAKTEFKKLQDGRTTVSSAGDALITEQANTRYKLADNVQKAGITVDVATEKAELDKTRQAIDKIVEESGLNKTEDGSLGDLKAKAKAEVDAKVTAAKAEPEDKWSAARKEIEQKIKDEKDAAKKKTLESQRDNLIKKEVREELAKDEKTAYGAFKKKATEVIKDKKTAYAEATKNNAEASAKHNEAIIKKLGENDTYKGATAKADGTAVEKLKHQIGKLSEKAEDLRKAKAEELVGEKGALKDLDISKFGKFLEKNKLAAGAVAAAVLGAAGVALAYIVGPKNEVPTDVA